jgi:hypothetical protein
MCRYANVCNVQVECADMQICVCANEETTGLN